MAVKKNKGKRSKRKTKVFENADVDQKRFLKLYARLCEENKSIMCSALVKSMKTAIESKLYVEKFIISPEENDDQSEPSLEVVIRCIRESFYPFIKELCVWDLELDHAVLTNLALLLERRSYKISKVDLMDCDVPSHSLERFSRCFKGSALTHLNLDYNEFGDEGCRLLCVGCKNNYTIVSLSLCYCNLTHVSGRYLSEVLGANLLCQLYLDGNELGCRGAFLLVSAVATRAEEDFERRREENRLKEMMRVEGALNVTDRELNTQMEVSETGVSENESSPKKRKKKKKKKRSKKKGDAPKRGPYVDVLHLRDNGVDDHGGHQTLAPAITAIQRLIAFSPRLKELDISHNSIGEAFSMDLYTALAQRKENKLPSMKLNAPVDVSSEIYKKIRTLAGGIKKRKRKGRKKKRKKK